MKTKENLVENQETVHNDTNSSTMEGLETPANESEVNQISDLDKAKAEAADWKDKYIRLYAEFENFRHRTSKEKMSLIGTATEGLMIDLLPVIDDFERSLLAIETTQDIKSLKEGVDLIYQKFIKTLNQKGLKAMDSIGKPFDADFQESITQIPSPTPADKGLVLDQVEKGYLLNDKTIRFAKVVIGA